MQFISGGPDIPHALLQAHEDGQVIFFCGAGISYPAGLPGYKKLVKKIYEKLGADRETLETAAFCNNQFDTTLQLLSDRLPGGDLRMRKALAEVLEPKSDLPYASTHKALLQLGQHPDGALRLITTNFDRIFHNEKKRLGISFHEFSAPLLPIPKKSTWNGLVFLHGVLPPENCLEPSTELNKLVVTSGDFGMAYLTERWAARFITELFRNFKVCFVGYSIEDPILRYMMDALAADRARGEHINNAWAFAGLYSEDDENSAKDKWRAKGVEPILYRVEGTNEHSLLHESLHAWADQYTKGALAKKRVIRDNALALPAKSTQQDNYVSRVLWALSDESGLPARQFANTCPSPSLDWFFDVFWQNEEISWMPTQGSATVKNDYQKILVHMGRWLSKHLDDPRLIVWAANHSEVLPDVWRQQFQKKLTDVPDRFPESLTYTLWMLILWGKTRQDHFHQRFDWWYAHYLNDDGLSSVLRLKLREILEPRLKLSPISLSSNSTSGKIKNHILREVVFAGGSAGAECIKKIKSDRKWSEVAPHLLDEAQILLLDALDLFRELGDASDFYDPSSRDFPSITEHWQNTKTFEWVELIELLRDAWLVLLQKDAHRAASLAIRWFEEPYPAFKRLALFAASQNSHIEVAIWVDWLLRDDSRWLWSPSVRREVMRLLVMQGRYLEGELQLQLESSILQGPPETDKYDTTKEAAWQRAKNREIWIRLAKLDSAGAKLQAQSKDKLTELQKQNPKFAFLDHEREEFLWWFSFTGAPDYYSKTQMIPEPHTRKKLIAWLSTQRQEAAVEPARNWREICKQRPLQAMYALKEFPEARKWAEDYWIQALTIWQGRDFVECSWNILGKTIANRTEKASPSLLVLIGVWLTNVPSILNEDDSSCFLDLCKHILALSNNDGTIYEGIDKDHIYHDALSHPVGLVTKALLNYLFNQNLVDNQGLPQKLREFFDPLADVEKNKIPYARVMLAKQLVPLYRLDRQWVEEQLLPLFDWQAHPHEAAAMWEGFLASPRLYLPLQTRIHSYFLDTADHLGSLSEHRHRYSIFLTKYILESLTENNEAEFRAAIKKLPASELEMVAFTLLQEIKIQGDRAGTYWDEHIRPFLRVWPQSKEKQTKSISNSFAKLIIASDIKFADAYETLHSMLQPEKNLFGIVSELAQSGLCTQYPDKALSFLNSIIGQETNVHTSNLEDCLTQIAKTQPTIKEDPSYRKLTQYLQNFD